MQKYKNATPEQAIMIFDRFQNGQALKVGERLHAMMALSPIVEFAHSTLMVAGSGLHDRAAVVWGPRAGEDKGRKNLLNAFALCAGCAFGPSHMTRKWPEIHDRKDPATGRMMLASNSFDRVATIQMLTNLITIYENAHATHPLVSKRVLNEQWNLGNYSGYIIWSFHQYPDDTERLMEGWTNYIVGLRRNPLQPNVLRSDAVSAARFWEPKRWMTGYYHVFHPGLPVPPLPADTHSDDSDSDDSE